MTARGGRGMGIEFDDYHTLEYHPIDDKTLKNLIIYLASLESGYGWTW